ncbi:MAG: fatty acid--CoA ligase family protein, partial [Alphaproteobacteria bacterium]|nr:fatty acid--CoA ligase family protein [Alphaproteobacteria bacterium]
PDDEITSRRDAVKDEDLSMILYTSGTTSNPKGCMLTGASIIHNGRTLADVYQMSHEDSFWSPLPMFHIAATLPIAGCVDRGAAYVTMPYFEAGTALKLLEQEKATITYPCFVTIISDLINHSDFDNTDLSHVRVMNSNLAVQPPGFAERLGKAMPDCIQVGTYGLSEASGTVTSSRLDDPMEVRTTRLGTPMPGQEVKIIDLETKQEVATGEKGEILVRGYNVLKGYYKDPEKTAQALDEEGWLHTGDVGSLDEHGTIMFHGRDKDMLKVGGENVAAAEIEALCQKHPAVKLCQVVPAPDDRLQEVAAAFIELKDGESVSEDELIEFCKGKIASFKIPRYVRTVTEWPMSTTKVQKYKLKEDIEAELKKQRGAAE